MADRAQHVRGARRPRPALIGALALGGIALVVLFGALAAMNALGQAVLWENAHWTIATIGACIIAILGVRWATREQRRMRRLVAIALACWVVGQLIWDVQVALDDTSIPGPSDVFFLGSVIPILVALRELVRGRLRVADEITVALDSLAIFFALAGLILIAFGPQALDVGGMAGAALLLYPVLLLAVGGSAVVIGLAVRTDPHPPGAAAILGGVLLMGLGQTVWVSSVLGARPYLDTASGIVISLGLILAGWGGATWTGRTLHDPRYDRLAGSFARVLPLLAVATAVVLVLADNDAHGTNLGLLLDGVVIAIITLAAVRQAFLFRDRVRMLDVISEAHRATSVALRHAEASEANLRRTADQRGRLLVAGQHLLVGTDTSALLDPVLELLVPDGAIGFVSGLSTDGEAIRVLAARGPGSEAIVGLVRQLDDLGPEIRARYVDPGPRAYRRRDPADLPAGIRAQPFCDDLVLSDAAATLTLPLVNREGRSLGTVNLVDPDGERILEPSFIEFARLVTNQMAVALQNVDLVRQLSEQIVDIRRVQEQLIQASKLTAIGELAAAVAHEVNNPLTGVLGYSDLLLAEKSADSADRESLEIIRAEAIRARTVIRALLDFARPRMPERRPTDVNPLVRSTLDILRHHLTQGGVTIVERYGDLPIVELDEDAIQQVLLHLLNNAAQAMPDAGTLTLTTAREDSDVVITVSDTGPGIPDHVRARIFEPFFTTREAVSGHGLGLSVSLGLVQSHGGMIAVRSAPGVGTSVAVRIPIVAPAGPGGATPTWMPTMAEVRIEEPSRASQPTEQQARSPQPTSSQPTEQLASAQRKSEEVRA
ncbi:MAG TPA: ATP-binding protein [Candidatus Saccharimonadales bacterium]|nr:ATP-binding protein [Candidatus Saccharimonadales bacterium]